MRCLSEEWIVSSATSGATNNLPAASRPRLRSSRSPTKTKHAFFSLVADAALPRSTGAVPRSCSEQVNKMLGVRDSSSGSSMIFGCFMILILNFQFSARAPLLFRLVILERSTLSPCSYRQVQGCCTRASSTALSSLSYFTAAMTSADPVWERFVACKLSQAPSFVSQTSENNSILGARSVNLTSGSIALNADAGTAGLMRDLAVKPVEEILSGKASQELASRNRYVRLTFSEFEWRLYYRTKWYPCWLLASFARVLVGSSSPAVGS